MPESKATTHKKGSTKSEEIESDDSLMHSMNESSSRREKNSSSFLTTKLFIFIVIAALLGVGTGYFLAQRGGKTGIASLDKAANSAKIAKGEVFGSDDTKTFKDVAEGQVKIGGVDGEGTHSLIRPGGDTQTVCMTSSHVDLGALDGRKVKVWGQTNTAETCGWLMDVGRVEVLD